MRISIKSELELGQIVDIELVERGQVEISLKGEVLETLPMVVFNDLFARRKKFKGKVVELNRVMPIRYYDLHRHSGYSLLDGMNKISAMVENTEYAGAISDHGVMYGVLEYYKQMNEAGKLPVLGFEAYTETIDGNKTRNHLLLLAKNEKGFKNLVKLTSLGYTNFYKKPQLNYDMLREYSEGVIVSTACMGGEVPRLLKEGKKDDAKKVCLELIGIFGKENFYIEVQRHNIEGEDQLNDALIELAKELGVKVIATTDSHFTAKEDNKIHEILLCLQTKKTMDDPKRMTFKGTGYHLHTSEEMEEIWADMPEVLDNTLDLVESIDCKLELGKIYMPSFPVPEGFKDEAEYFVHLCWKGFEERFKGTDKFTSEEYRERLEFEIETIKNMGFPGYFVIVWDFVNFAKSRKILVGPGRGSACGSLVAYALSITEVDPIPYGLLFERFLNPDRVSMPDIDLDFDDRRREEVIDYVKGKYGERAVSRIITFGTLAAKAVVRDVARVLGKPYALGDKISKSIPKTPKMTLKKAFEESQEFANMYQNDPEVREIVDIAMKLEGLPKNIGQHACFDAESLITTSKGLKRIIDVQIGDEVLTHNKRFKPVVDTMVTYTEEVYSLKTSSSFPVDVTGNHPFYVREMKVIGKRNEKGNRTSLRTFGEAKWKAVEDLTINKDYIGVPINQNSIIPQMEDISLPFGNKNFWWVIGRYIGDGWTERPMYVVDNSSWYNERVIICCSKVTDEEKMVITNKLDEIGFKYWIEEANTTYKIHITDSKDLFKYLQSFGKYAQGKYINQDVFDLPKELVKSFLEGYISADGSCLEATKRYNMKTVSKNLAIGLMQLVNKAYDRPATLGVIKPKTEFIGGRKVYSKEKYEIHFTEDIRTREKSFYEDGYIWTRVSKLTKREESKAMYNLTVLDDSSYVVHGLGVHNCGVIIAPSAVDNYIPQVLIENEDTGLFELTTQFTMAECEEMGLLKMDFLGLRTMGVVGRALEDINPKRIKLGLPSLTFMEIPTNDVRVYDFIAKGNTEGVFQLESPGMTSFMKELFQDVHSLLAVLSKEALYKKGEELFERAIAGISLYRPGPIDEIPNYIANMLNPEKITYEVPQLKPILDNTYSVIVYQEQCMFIVRELAGFSKGMADTVRKAFSKKKEKMIAPLGEKFIYGQEDENGNVIIEGCVRRGIPEAVAQGIWDKMKKFGSYAFNKSHAGGYAEISIRTAWLAFYYPTEYMSATLNSFITKSDKIKTYLSVCKKKNIQVLPPHVNISRQAFTVDGEAIRFGLMGIKNMGKTSTLIIAERDERGEFLSFQDFAERMAKFQKVGTKVLEALIYSGAVDNFPGTRRAKLAMVDDIMDVAKKEKKLYESPQINFFELAKEADNQELVDSFSNASRVEVPDLQEFDKRYKLEKEKEFAGFYVTEHPLDDYSPLFAKEGVYEIGLLAPSEDEEGNDDEDERSFSLDGEKIKIAGIVKDIKTYYTKSKNEPMNVFTIEDRTGEIKCVAFPKDKIKNEDKIVEGKIVIVNGTIQDDERGLQIIVKTMVDVDAMKLTESPQVIFVKGSNNRLWARKQWTEVKNLVESNKGDIDVVFDFGGQKHIIPAKMEFTLSTICSLQNIMGENNVHMIYSSLKEFMGNV